MDTRKEIKVSIEKTIKSIYGLDFDVQILKPKEKTHGDFAISSALEIGKIIKRKPMEVALEIKDNIQSDLFEKKEIVEPGFINFFISPKIIKEEIKDVLNNKFNNLEIGKEKIQIEFISANPTGPLTVGNGRGGPVGDVLGNVFKKAGHSVEKAYYVNDHGKQILSLGQSILKQEEAKYSGEYIDELALRVKENDPHRAGKEGAKIILEEMIKKTVANLGINFDEWFSEDTLYEKGEVDKTIEILKKKDLAYESEGALWFKATNFGDERDRVLIKTDKEKTYLRKRNLIK